MLQGVVVRAADDGRVHVSLDELLSRKKGAKVKRGVRAYKRGKGGGQLTFSFTDYYFLFVVRGKTRRKENDGGCVVVHVAINARLLSLEEDFYKNLQDVRMRASLRRGR